MSYLRVQLMDNPTYDDLCKFWKHISADPSISGNFSDYFPLTLDEFIAPIDSGTSHVYLGWCDGDIVSGHWYHDWGMWGYPHAAFVAAWHRPDVRGKIGIKPQLEAHFRAECELGITTILSTIRWNNYRSHEMAIKLGSKFQAIYKDWTWFQGELDAVRLYSMYDRDYKILMDIADQKAMWHQANPPKTVMSQVG